MKLQTIIICTSIICAPNMLRGSTELFQALYKGDVAQARKLISQSKNLATLRDGKGNTPLHAVLEAVGTDIITEEQALSLIKELIPLKGINVNAQNVAQQTALMMAALFGLQSVITYLDTKTHVDYTLKDSLGKTASAWAQDIASRLQNPKEKRKFEQLARFLKEKEETEGFTLIESNYK
ncbi:MAG: ankyrin repeat domain-containing protein [Candidatus Babeliales bacterium]